jgi:large subunit ribosomal protein L4
MAKAEVLNWDKKSVGQLELPADIFEVAPREDVLHSIVRWQLACRRQGTHQTKTRGEVRGGGKKPFKQKGTGNARQGSSRSPLMPGGAILFGPRPRNYAYALPKQFKRLALRTALSALYRDGKMFIVDEMTSEGKTKELHSRLKKFGVDKALLIDESTNPNFSRASKNLRFYKYFSVDGLNVFDVLKFEHLILTRKSVEKIVERCRVG